MNRLSFLAIAALAFAAPATAVSVTGVVANGNDWQVFTAEPGLLEMDFGLRGQSPVIVSLAPDAGETGFDFNSVVGFYIGFNGPNNTQRLVLGLTGATFEALGSIAPTFVGYSVFLDRTATRLVIRFDEPGEPSGVVLGNVFGDGENFRILFNTAPLLAPDARNLPASFATVDGATLSVQAVVPEPATWAMLIAGFGLVGSALRRRRSIAA